MLVQDEDRLLWRSRPPGWRLPLLAHCCIRCAATVWSLSDNNGQSLILVRDGLSAFDPKRTELASLTARLETASLIALPVGFS
jgi:hypothetical protein